MKRLLLIVIFRRASCDPAQNNGSYFLHTNIILAPLFKKLVKKFPATCKTQILSTVSIFTKVCLCFPPLAINIQFMPHKFCFCMSHLNIRPSTSNSIKYHFAIRFFDCYYI